MITNTGKSIIAKYLVGQAPAYASYIAIGCGPTPLPSDFDFNAAENAGLVSEMYGKTDLDFEMFRVRVDSRGFVNENGINKIVLTAELPTEERYEITEVGLYSAGSNPTVGAYDSKTVYVFNDSENWEYHSQQAAQHIPSIYIPIDNEDNIIAGEYKINPVTREYDPNGTMTQLPVFKTNADNKIFTNSERESRYERCRFLNGIVMVQGDDATLSVETVGGVKRLKVEPESNHIHLTGTSLDFNKNSPSDELKLAFSVISKNGESTVPPDQVRILVEFSSSDIHGSGEWARFEVDIDDTNFVAGTSSVEHNFSDSRYVIATKQLQDLRKSTGFTWSEVDVAKFYVSVIKDGDPSPDYYVGLDAFRLDNKSQANPLYGLTGYSIIKNTGAQTIVKNANTTNYIEFRFGMDVQ